MPADKGNKQITYFSLVEIKKIGSQEEKRVVDGVSGKNVDIEFIGGIWKRRQLKIPCPECHGLNTFIEFSIQDVGWDGAPYASKSGGSINSIIGLFDINCDDCKKVFIYSPSGNIRLNFIEESPYPEKKHDKQSL
jgi:hypothetical protein